MSVTELDDLKSVWQTLNRNLERQHTLALHQFKETKMARFRSGLRPLVLGQLLQLVIGVAITLASAQFWVNHIGAPLLLICGLFLHGYGIMKEVSRQSEGQYNLGPGTLYDNLQRLMEQGLVQEVSRDREESRPALRGFGGDADDVVLERRRVVAVR